MFSICDTKIPEMTIIGQWCQDAMWTGFYSHVYIGVIETKEKKFATF